MLLVIDVGNTNFVLGLYKKEKLVKCWRMTTGGNRTADETGIFIHGLFDAAGIDAGKVEAVIISSDAGDSQIFQYRTDDRRRWDENGDCH